MLKLSQEIRRGASYRDGREAIGPSSSNESHETAATPSEHPDTRRIGAGNRVDDVEKRHDIFDITTSEFVGTIQSILLLPSAATSVLTTNNDESLIRQGKSGVKQRTSIHSTARTIATPIQYKDGKFAVARLLWLDQEPFYGQPIYRIIEEVTLEVFPILFVLCPRKSVRKVC